MYTANLYKYYGKFRFTVTALLIAILPYAIRNLVITADFFSPTFKINLLKI